MLLIACLLVSGELIRYSWNAKARCDMTDKRLTLV